LSPENRSPERPRVLIIDDEEGSVWGIKTSLLNRSISCEVLAPLELKREDLFGRSLILVDQHLNFGWPPETLLVQAVPDGLALATCLRRVLVGENAVHELHATAFALISGELNKLPDPLPWAPRPLLASQHNLEWVFDKAQDKRIDQQIASLANAAHQIPAAWSDGINGIEELRSVLGLEGAEDGDSCWRAIEKCYPPIRELTRCNHGLAFVRWMLQSILSYPCFLWDERRVAARFRVTVDSFRAALSDSSSRLKSWLHSSEYTGMLSDFNGTRWWGHRIEMLAWESTKGDSQEPSLLRAAIAEAGGVVLDPTTMDLPVICIDSSMDEVDEFEDFESAIRVNPDGWPPFAEQAWMRITEVRGKSNLHSMVIPEDGDRINT
jgi:hypothetical protein